jgi:hypothetical protein
VEPARGVRDYHLKKYKKPAPLSRRGIHSLAEPPCSPSLLLQASIWGTCPSLVPPPLALTQLLPLAGAPSHHALSELLFLTLGTGRHAFQSLSSSPKYNAQVGQFSPPCNIHSQVLQHVAEFCTTLISVNRDIEEFIKVE